MSEEKKKSTKAAERPNRLCLRCLRACRQSEQVLLLDCPRFVPRPFKVQKPPGRQLDLFGKN
ncbi:hypothetical protein [Geoalkalibacter sp.]|jgi:hypothetical protein|uniref:hypothetical protein n=1 Tax=Geoalkalibacter sp. TaxID=3041440 RepID=UPI00272E7538|nr:hypothetical protein [Geoalkalibacter sp.]